MSDHVAVKSVLAKALEDGWPGLSDLDERARAETEKHMHEQRLVDADVAEMFATEPGRRVLEKLIQDVLLTPSWPGMDMAGDKLAAHGSYIEGRKSLVQAFLASIARAQRSGSGAQRRRKSKDASQT